MPLLPWIDPKNFNPGYVMRGMHVLPLSRSFGRFLITFSVTLLEKYVYKT